MKEATLQSKIAQVEEVAAKMNDSQSSVVVDVIGLTVAETMALRKELYANGCELHVIKNNIIRRASEKCGYEGLAEALKGLDIDNDSLDDLYNSLMEANIQVVTDEELIDEEYEEFYEEMREQKEKDMQVMMGGSD